jgi:hypothetical protein
MNLTTSDLSRSSQDHNINIAKNTCDWIIDTLEIIGVDYKRIKTQLMNVLIETRSNIRSRIKSLGSSVMSSGKDRLYQILDNERNVSLKNVGINLEDVAGKSV